MASKGERARLFDAYLAVDWSARNGPSPARPSADALWVGEGRAPAAASDPPPAIGTSYWRTRRACVAFLRERLLHHAARGRRVCVGFDFAFGFPTGLPHALGLAGAPGAWRRVWAELERLLSDDADNRNNRFTVAAALNQRCGGATPGPFWGCPTASVQPALRPTSPVYPYPVRVGFTLERLRWTDRHARGVQPVWKLFGSGSVGGQTLTGIPAVARLRDDPQLAAISRVWPFETGFTCTPTPTPPTGPAIIYAEIWPSLAPAQPTDGTIRDQAQVHAMVRWLAATDAAGRLGRWFAPPTGLPRETLAACAAQEGWILGAGTATTSSPS